MQTVSTSSPDPLLETQVFWTRYRGPILIGIAVILLGLAVYGGYRLYSIRRDEAAANLLANAKGAPDYEKVISDYPGSGAAASASLLLATQQREKQQFAEAKATLQKFIAANPQHQLVTTAKMAMAANSESLGKADEALEMYRRIGADYPKSFNAPLALLAQVPLLKAKGQVEEARRVCETVLTQYRDSFTSMEASRYLKTLKPAVASVVPNPSAATPQAAPNGSASVVPSPAASVSPVVH